MPSKFHSVSATVSATLLALASAFAVAPASAQGYPERRVEYLIPFPAGGESDVAARLQQVVFAQKFKQEMVVVNRAGGGGALVWQQLNTLPGDGYTIAGINLPHVVLQPLEGTVSYKTDDMTPVYWFHYTPDALIVPASSPFQTFQDFLKAAKADPGKLSIAGSALNSANHVAHARLNREFGIRTEYVPFKGTGDLISSVLGGHVAATMSYTTLAIQQKGKMRMLAVATAQRVPQFPDVPTFRELGIDWIDGAYRGVAVPKSTPEHVRKQVSVMMDAINKDPDLRKKMVDGGFEVIDVSYDRIPAFMKTRTAEYMNSAKLLGLVK
ncbi:MAG: tripartite tricarboxylate transporter substrate binding protein [Burkholderiales bacterium]|nr:tripartite tricarboxylate transporter substrate binding protein [Burkholderiales bacterium]MCC7114584.1 tripartite tricarboxylate transporter substrate binding protein [Burkholderiales bacterium]